MTLETAYLAGLEAAASRCDELARRLDKSRVESDGRSVIAARDAFVEAGALRSAAREIRRLKPPEVNHDAE